MASEKAVGELSSQASDVQVSPQGNLSSSTVQSALEELQGDINTINAGEMIVKDDNYVHTDENYTAAEKSKLAGIETGAQVNEVTASDIQAAKDDAIAMAIALG